MDVRRHVRFAPPPGVLRAPALPARFRRLPRGDAIRGITKPAIRRLARRGGVKRIQATIYEDVRQVIKSRLREILYRITEMLKLTGPRGRQRKTINTEDVIFVLKHYIGTPIYGFDAVYIQSRGGVVRSKYFR